MDILKQEEYKKNKYYDEEAKSLKQEEINKSTEIGTSLVEQDSIYFDDRYDQPDEEQLINEKYNSMYSNERKKKKDDLSDRQKNKLKKDAKKLVRTTKTRRKEMRQKVEKMANTYMESNGLSTTSGQIEYVKQAKVFNDVSKEEKLMVDAVKKTAPIAYKRYVSYGNYLAGLLKGEKSEKTDKLITFVTKEYEKAKSEWENINSKIESGKLKMEVPIKVMSEADHDNVIHEYNKKNPYHMIDKPYPDTFSIDTLLTPKVGDDYFEPGEMKSMLKKRKIDWSKNYCFDTKGKSKEESDEIKKQRDEVKNGLGDEYLEDCFDVLGHIQSQMEEIIKEEKDKNGVDVTKEEIDELVTTYLKKVVSNSEFCFRCNNDAFMGIIHNYSNSRASDKYDSMFAHFYQQHYIPKNYKGVAQGTLTYGYLGGKNAKEYFGYKNEEKDTLSLYGNLSIRLNKEKFKDSVGFVVGNSLGHYKTFEGEPIDRVRGRNTKDPDILCAGNSLKALYKRAKEVKANNWKTESPEQEAKYVSRSDGDQYKYFEAHYVGPISAPQIDEVTYIWDSELSNDIEAIKKAGTFKKNTGLRESYEMIKFINANKEKFSREDMPDMKISVWDKYGHTVTFNDLKMIFG